MILLLSDVHRQALKNAVAERVGSVAGSGEVLVSGTVRDVLLGSGIEFSDRNPGSNNVPAATFIERPRYAVECL
jgi:hypothetical protein